MENDWLSYRQTVRRDGCPLGYEAPTGVATIDERVLHPMTVWRMLSWLGGQLVALAVGRQRIQEHNPRSTCHRFVGAVAPHKYRSRQRERVLRQARQLLHLSAEWDVTFAEKFFPRFATRAGFF